jgi:NAD(P)-dependent dehydrogenase (short-subunit alcohol dehydrogenase family)
VIADINKEALQETKKLTESISKDVSVTVVQLDVRDEKSVKNLIDVAISTYGRIDYCANVAGIIKFGDTTVLPTEDFDLVYEINLRGVFLCAKYQISAMLEQEPLASK